MAEFWALNGFYDATQVTGLYEAIPHRVSCRAFQAAPSAQQWAGLEEAAKELALPGTRMQLGLCDNSLFQPFFGLLTRFENAQRYVAVITTQDTPESIINAGVSGEMLMLQLVAQGLGGVWVAGTYKHKALQLPLQSGERVRALIALGVPAQPPTAPVQRKRKPLERLCTPALDGYPGMFQEAARAVQAAPSALNQQPWLMAYNGQEGLSIRVEKPRQRLDLGIALCHALLALGRRHVTCAITGDGLGVEVTVKP